MTTTTPTQTYDVSWNVCITANASMQVEAPAGLSGEELKTFIREECSADFSIDADECDYSDGFEELDCNFYFECAE